MIKKEHKTPPSPEQRKENRIADAVGKALQGKKCNKAGALDMQRKKSLETYYRTCAFPKPTDKKKEKASNGYKNKPARICQYCGQAGAERHEVFGGSNRQTSIREKFQVDVCNKHHKELHENCSEWAVEENKRLKRSCQLWWMKKAEMSGIKEKDALSLWMALIGKNYVEELMPE